MSLDMVNIYLEENADLFDNYMDLVGSCKKENISLDYYDTLDYYNMN